MAWLDLVRHGWLTAHTLLTPVGLLVYAIGSHTLGQRRHPAAAFSWVVTILLLPEVAVPAYLLLGTRKLPKAGRHRRAPEPGPAPQEGPVLPWIWRLTATMSLPPPAPYRRLELHADGAQARRALERVIDGARERLDVSTFIVGRDRFGDAILARLAARARAGVRVRLLVDGVGTWMGGRRDFTGLARAGVRVVRFMPPMRSPLRLWVRGRTNLRNHRKIVVADGERLWSGGRNLAGEYFEGREGRPAWVDFSFDLEGDVARQAEALFESDWTAARSESAVAAQPLRFVGPPPGSAAAQLVPSGPDYADDTIYTLLLTSTYRARDRIVAVTPYLVPDDSLVAALAIAARRGVAVDIVVPRRSNHRLADIARNRPMRDLAAAGVRLWLAGSMVHAKMVVVDDRVALAGSANLDSRSLFLNYELMTAFYEHGDVERFAHWAYALRDAARPYRARTPGLARSVFEGLVLWLGFQL